MTNRFTVAVRCFTFNQSPFIEKTLHGFATQETSAPIVYIVVDDASTDGEQNVIKRWAETNLECDEKKMWCSMPYGLLLVATLKEKSNLTFVFLLLSKNHYEIEQKKYEYFSEWYDNAKYHAMCEGDDYWVDSSKLQSQIECLDKNEDVVLCYTDSIVVNGKSQKVISNKPKHHEGDCLYPLVHQGNFIMTASICYRSMYEGEWWSFCRSIPFPLMMGDYPKWVFLASKGKIAFINKEMVAYRMLSESASHSSDINHVVKFAKNLLDLRMYFNKVFNLKIKESHFEKSYYKNIIRVAAKYDYNTFIKIVTEGTKKYPSLILNYKFITIFVLRTFFGKRF